MATIFARSTTVRAQTAMLVLCTIMLSSASFAQKASNGQQIAVLKALKTDLKIVGVIGSNITEKMTQDMTRAGLSQGINVIIAKVNDPREIASLYKKLVSEKKIQMLWLPDAGDGVMMGIGMEFLKENTAMDRVGLCVPVKNHVASGALCSVQSEDGKLNVYVNKKIAAIVGVVVPAEMSGIGFVMQ